MHVVPGLSVIPRLEARKPNPAAQAGGGHLLLGEAPEIMGFPPAPPALRPRWRRQRRLSTGGAFPGWPRVPGWQDSQAQLGSTLSPLPVGDLGHCVSSPSPGSASVKWGEGTCFSGAHEGGHKQGQTFSSCPGVGKSCSWGPPKPPCSHLRLERGVFALVSGCP